MGSDGYLAGLTWVGLLVLLRVAPIALFSPAFGGPVVPQRFRVALGLILAATLALQLPPTPPPSLMQAVGLAVKELIVGVAMAVAITLVFDAFAMAGALIDQFRGVTSADALDPTGGEPTSGLAVFYKLFALVLFLSAGGYGLLLRALADSLRLLPPTAALPAEFATTAVPAAVDLLTFLGRLLVLAVQISAPVLLLGVVVDVSLALLGRMAALSDTASLGPTLKAPLGVLVCLLSLSVAVSRVPDAIADLLLRVGSGATARTVDSAR